MAVDLWNELIVEAAEEFSMDIKGEGAEELPRDSTNLVVTGVEKAFELSGSGTPPPFKYTLINKIPFARGLGSSSAAIVAGLIAGLVLAGHELEVEGHEKLLNIAADIEGHPDNSAPCVYGGFQLGIFDNVEARWSTFRINIPSGLQCVMFVPDLKIETKTARGLVKDTISRSDAVYNMARTALLVRSFCMNDMGALRLATEDAMHQIPRSTAYPALYPVINAALAAGAHGAFLSGSGSTIMAITSGLKGDAFHQIKEERLDVKVGEAMLQAAADCGLKGRIYASSPSDKGAYVVRKNAVLMDNI
ncbi:homoserine kinase [Sphaeroforma arctica JP610]|uniref:Homoserine kinase n=1 Tax=Sphaeroforma arctica JP610 TaxID=667725 RepID=A0A0L0GBZ1_9EUKA|nr:homoserine kinase [Sphaeroforma arctica JP610]KNC86510.1 homoserine kinase [Sphaeroforma arctica JP610]|eukprot:XP_014160412.1 homoserine kinase [Sphaeroforma arctica JP610]